MPGQEVTCDLAAHVSDVHVESRGDGKFAVYHRGDPQHHAVIRDYAWPGSETVLNWQAGDRREYEGEYPGPCPTDDCVYHYGHHGRCEP
jgi:hypothetical protein